MIIVGPKYKIPRQEKSRKLRVKCAELRVSLGNRAEETHRNPVQVIARVQRVETAVFSNISKRRFSAGAVFSSGRFN